MGYGRRNVGRLGSEMVVGRLAYGDIFRVERIKERKVKGTLESTIDELTN